MISDILQQKDFNDEIFVAMGYGQHKNLGLQPMINEMTELAETVAKKSYYFDVLHDEILIDSTTIKGNDFTFSTGKIINNQLTGATKIAVFVVTLGEDFDSKLTELFSTGETIKAYIFDSIGSVLVEKIADKMELQLANQLAEGLGYTNRFSPGYCGWHVKEQQILFRLIPEHCCGITLNNCSLMKPIKSISGIIGIGKGLCKKDYACSLCNLETCYKRRR